ncbi:MAG: bifunctional nicotinamidase/pyrazinamidase [Planctomycetaceae bacterium]|nr:bifunctional nicotinamidase/pyrazinamidase [Planctomycetaceae bacterium]
MNAPEQGKAVHNRAALILVDLQNDFVEGGTLAVPDGHSVIPIANRLMTLFPLVVATQDWHPADHQSFASQHPGMRPGDQFQLNGQPQTAWPDHCIQGSTGASLVNALDLTSIDAVIQKGQDRAVDSYSGFFDNGRLRETELGELLRKNDIRTVFVMGLATDYCVRFTALDAVREGFETILITDGCRGVELSPGDVTKAIQQMTGSGVQLIQSGDLYRAVDSGS